MYLCYGKFCTEKHTTNLLAYTRKSGKKGGKEIYQSAWSENPPNFALGRLSWAADFEVPPTHTCYKLNVGVFPYLVYT